MKSQDIITTVQLFIVVIGMTIMYHLGKVSGAQVLQDYETTQAISERYSDIYPSTEIDTYKEQFIRDYIIHGDIYADEDNTNKTQ